MISWLSGFLFNPWMAAGAGAVASPILIHILSRRRYRRVRWAAMDFLLDAHRRNRRRVRIEQLILLALRCLVVLLLALAFARPFLSSGLLAGMIGGSQTEHIIVLDDSFSMSAVSRGAATGTRLAAFDAGKEAVEAIGQIVSETASSDAITLYVTSRPDEPVLSLPNASDENRVRLTEALAGLTSTQRGGNWDVALRSVARQISTAPARANAVVYAISDFQRSDWGVAGTVGDPATKGPLASLAALNDEKDSVRCMLVSVGEQTGGNIAVTSISADRPLAVAGVPTRFNVGVANHSTEVLRDVELGVAIEGRRLPPLVIREIMPDETVREPVEVTFDQDGANFIDVELVGAASSIDSVALDNRRLASVDVAGSIRVLIVDGEPSSDPYRDETFLLKTALRPAGRATSGIDVTVVEEGEIEVSDLSQFQVAILANVGRITRAGNEKLRAFVEAGGGLVVFAGDLVDVAEYNASMYDGGRGLLPLPIVGPAEAPPGADAIAISSWDAAHPMLRAFEGPTAELLRQVRIDAYLRVDEADKAASGEAAPESAVVIARLNDAYQSPIMIEKAIGRGRTIFFATSADQEWNDWASNFSYLPIVLETVQYVAKPSAGERDVVVGAVLRCEFDPTLVENTVVLRTPGFPTDPEIVLNATPLSVDGDGSAERRELNGSGATSIATFGDTDRTGRYEFRLKRTRGGTIQRFSSVNPDARESDLRPATAAELRTVSDKLRIEIIDDVAVLASAAADGRSEIWWPLMLVVAALMMIEHGLAWRFGTNH